MASLTSHFGFTKLAQGDPFSTNDQAFTTSDIDEMDRLTYVGAIEHRHNGAAVTQPDPTTGLSLTLNNGAGFLPAGTRVTYKYTYVDPNGFETAASSETYIDLPPPIASPATPTLAATIGTGTLPAGNYYYELSAYTGCDTAETIVGAPAFITLSAIGEIIITFPSLPAGATGFNIYRRDPNAVNYVFLDTTTASTYTDDGSVTTNVNRTSPNVNSTNSTNEVTASLPGATPSIPAGYTWRLYRTLITGQWTNSLLYTVVEGTFSYLDVGAGATAGMPPTTSELIGSPSKVLLTGGAEVQGTLPSAVVATYPMVVSFAFPGPLALATGQSVWVNDFASAHVESVRAVLGRGSRPAAQPVIVNVDHGTGATPTYSSIFAAMATPTYPTVPVGLQMSALVYPGTTLAMGDSLTVDVTQIGGGATPTDHDLIVNIVLLVSGSGLTDYSS
jgi:hypothetical protein